MAVNISTLLEALPYIKKFKGARFVVKAGGEVLSSDEHLENIAQDAALLQNVGIKTVLVHGGGKQISEIMRQRGIKPNFVNGLRVTDEKTISAVKEGLGQVNKKFVRAIAKQKEKVVGLAGSEVFKCDRKKTLVDGKQVDLGLVGEVASIAGRKIEQLLNKGYIPVVSCLGQEISSGKTLNINADETAAALAIQLRAEKLFFLTNVPGLLQNPSDKKTLVREISLKKLEEIVGKGKISGGMLPKLKSGAKALRNKVSAVHIINGLSEHPLLKEVFSDKGIGTMITR